MSYLTRHDRVRNQETWRDLWSKERTLYSHLAIQGAEERTKEALEEYGHLGPNRIPPHEVSEMVKEGSR